MLIHVTYRYTTDTSATGTLSGVMLADPKKVIEEAEKARRKNRMIRLTNATEGIAHAFPAVRLVDVEIRPATDKDAAPHQQGERRAESGAPCT